LNAVGGHGKGAPYWVVFNDQDNTNGRARQFRSTCDNVACATLLRLWPKSSAASSNFPEFFSLVSPSENGTKKQRKTKAFAASPPSLWNRCRHPFAKSYVPSDQIVRCNRHWATSRRRPHAGAAGGRSHPMVATEVLSTLPPTPTPTMMVGGLLRESRVRVSIPLPQSCRSHREPNR